MLAQSKRIAAISGVALILIVIAPTVSQADTMQVQPIYAQNNTSRTIWVASRYAAVGTTNFVATGWWQIHPGQRVLLLYNTNRYIYFNAHDDQGNVWNGNAASVMIGSETVNMFQADTGPCFDCWTMNFNPGAQVRAVNG